MSPLTRDRRVSNLQSGYRRLWRFQTSLGLGFAILLAGCASTPTPLPTLAQLSGTSATEITTEIALQSSATPRPTIVRTPLPSVTPLATASRNTAASSAPATGPTKTIAPAQGEATVAPARPSAPTSTSALAAATVSKNTTPLPTSPSLLPGNKPSFTINLPVNWKAAYQVIPVSAVLVGAQVNMAIYNGPLKNGTGTIIVLWNYPSLGPPPPVAGPGPTATPAPGVTPLDYQSELLWSDGLRMLQGTVLDITCNVGHYNEQTFPVGGKSAIGAYYNASQCPGTPDTAGWFAGVNPFGVSYLFYVYIDPIEAYNDGRGDIQKVLDSIQFLQPTPVPSPNGPPPTNTPAK